MQKPVTLNILRVAIPSPLRRCFDYRCPEDFATDLAGGQLVPGRRVRVPFGRKQVIGILEAVTQETQVAPQKLKSAQEILERRPVLEPDLLYLCRWASQYYHHPLGEVYNLAIPASLRRGSDAENTNRSCWRLTAAGRELDPASLRRAPRQAQVLNRLQQTPAGMDISGFSGLDGDWRAALRTLQDKDLVETCPCPTPAEYDDTTKETVHALNTEQAQAVQQIVQNLDHYHACLLHGVTGSGKTEVYLQSISRVLEQQRQVLILVPEIGLTPQLLQRFQRRFSVPIAVLHSALNDTERLRAWQDARSGRARIIIGTRSAIFTPLHAPGMIIVDEEHDVSLKQQDGLRYSARDLALVRAQHLQIPIVLGSATPSLESLHNAAQGRYHLLRLPERAGAALHPSMSLIDVRGQPMDEGLSQILLQQIRRHLDQQGQVLLFLNRRGYSPTLLCHECGWVAVCQRCDAHMTLHRGQGKLRCHHCGAERRIESHCPDCNSVDLRAVGQGTERTEEALHRHFPEQRIARIDRDTTRRKGSMEKMLLEAEQGHSHLLLGTQLLAKGHHFPNVTLVAILDSDQGLYGTDFRAGERMAQLVLQVAGRAGRADRPGEVWIQTHHPEHPLLQLMLKQDYQRIAEILLQERRATQLPPFSSLALLRAEAPRADYPMQFLQEARRYAHEILGDISGEIPGNCPVNLLGPLPAPMEKRAGRYRAQLLLQAEKRADLQRLLTPWVAQLETLKSGNRVRWSLDVDPQDMY